ncbi:PQQ-binding-like beta-propeller repeat protein [Streptomyces sp. ACA25]|uniref:outer membrane protein assembly factor BamB family protein n=1 Tax=Streptomyces sp. ACA25 TaxID=3022596 RepID=UPI002308279D|nr:PQQ-binding-like beta-propeller repeat protein [Streptomyces sp. ACA25]MDB1087261.1 PQQ-binding-like beta-propeller repeat protein [Streptomyces sp. ACA25]
MPPPAGGFGPPQSPPPGGFGPPPATPPGGQPQPGYGYPQPGYGYPQQPPGPPGYGYPEQPGYGAPGPYAGAPTAPMPHQGWTPPPGGVDMAKPPSSGGGKGLQIVLVVAVVLALVAGGAGAAWYFLGLGDDSSSSAKGGDDDGDGDGDEGDGGDEGGEDAEGAGEGLPDTPIDAELSWQVMGPEMTEDDNIFYSSGHWIVGDTLVRLMIDEVVAYRLDDGEVEWTLPVSTNEGNCSASRTVSEGRIALLQGRDCEHLTVVDVTTGEEVWTLAIDPPNSVGPDRNDVPAILGDVVAVGSFGGGYGFRIGAEEKVWEPRGNESCQVRAYAVVDDNFIEEVSCGPYGDATTTLRATTEDGDELWAWEAPREYDDEKFEFRALISAEPLVVLASLGDSILEQEWRIFTVDESYEKIENELEFDEERHVRPCDFRPLADCFRSVVHDGMLYLSSRGSYTEDNAVVAFELSSGNALWEAAPVNGGQIMPVSVVDGKILAYQPAGYEKAGLVVAIDPETEQATPVMALDHDALELERSLMSRVDDLYQHPVWHEDRFLLVQWSFYQHRAEDGDPAILVYE